MLKPISRAAEVGIISEHDTAIDVDESDLKSYAEKMYGDPGCWREFIKAKPGESLTVFRVGVIPPDTMARISDEYKNDLSSHGLQWASFIASLRDVEGWSEEVPKVKIDGIDYVDPKWVKRTFVRGLRNVGEEIGLKAFVWNQFTEEAAKN